jgi:flagellin
VVIIDILDVLRTIAVESSSSSLTSTDRSVHATESAELINELESLATSTSFNQRSLLDGTQMGLSIQAGPNSAQSISLSISSSNPSNLGAYSSVGPTREALAAATSAAANTTTTSEDIVLVNSSGSTTLQVGDNESAKTVAASINAVSAETSISAEGALALVESNKAKVCASAEIDVNGTSTSSFAISSSSVSDAVSKINLISTTTGVTATTTTSNQVLHHDIDGDDIVM